MEELNQTSRSGNLPPAAIVSTMTTVTENGTSVTQITSQTIDEFEPDPKWEMTTLEKASFEPTTTQEQQEDSEFSSLILNQTADDTQMKRVIDNLVELDGCQQFVCEVLKATVENPAVDEKEDEKKEKSDTTQDTASTEPTTTKNQLEEDDFNSILRSQAADDTQMEKVINNIVELGGCQQFVQTLGVLDKEKEVEDIEREISGARISQNLSENLKPTLDVQCRENSDLQKAQTEESAKLDVTTQSRAREQSSESISKSENPTSDNVTMYEKTEEIEEKSKYNQETLKETSNTKQDDRLDSSVLKPESEVVQIEKLKDNTMELDKQFVCKIATPSIESAAVDEKEEEKNKGSQSVEDTTREEAGVEDKEEVVDEREQKQGGNKGKAEKEEEEKVLDIKEPVPATEKSIESKLRSEPSSELGEKTDSLLEQEREPKQELLSDLELKTDSPMKKENVQKVEARPRRASKRSLDKELIRETKVQEPLEKSIKTSTRRIAARTTIATSAPSIKSVPQQKLDMTLDEDFMCKKFKCHDCGYSTERLNNIVYHKKNSCQHFQKNWNKSVENYISGLVKSPKSNRKRASR